jgi:hypothetical protein
MLEQLHGPNQILERIAIDPTASFEESQARVIERLQSLGIPMRTKDEEHLANLTHLLTPNAREAAETYEQTHRLMRDEMMHGVIMKQSAEQGADYAGGYKGRFLGIEKLSEEEGRSAVARILSDTEPGQMRRGLTGISSARDVEALSEEVIGYLGKNRGGLGTMARDTLEKIIESGGVAAKLMRFRV